MSRVMKMTRRLVLSFDPSDRRTPTDLSRAAVQFIWLTRVYYLIAAYVIISGRFDSLQSAQPTDTLWPLDLVEGLFGRYIIDNLTTTVAFSVSAVALLAVFFPRILIWRLGVFLYFFYIDALSNSFGFPGYATRIHVFVSFAFLFLPSISDIRGKIAYRNVLSCLAVFWLTQALLLVTYSISGFWKLRDSGTELFAADGMTRILISRALSDTLDIPLLLPVIVPHIGLTHLMQLTMLYVQLSAIFALFRPHLHRPFGILLVLFHFGTDWILNIRFPANIVIVGLFLILSPTAPRRFSLMGFIQSLPVLGIPFRAWVRLRSSDKQIQVDRAWLICDSRGRLLKYYISRLQVEENIGELVLTNSHRDSESVVAELSHLPDRLDTLLTLKVNGKSYTDRKAIRMLALQSNSSGYFGILNRTVLSSPLGALTFYALIKFESFIWK